MRYLSVLLILCVVLDNAGNIYISRNISGNCLRPLAKRNYDDIISPQATKPEKIPQKEPAFVPKRKTIPKPRPARPLKPSKPIPVPMPVKPVKEPAKILKASSAGEVDELIGKFNTAASRHDWESVIDFSYALGDIGVLPASAVVTLTVGIHKVMASSGSWDWVVHTDDPFGTDSSQPADFFKDTLAKIGAPETPVIPLIDALNAAVRDQERDQDYESALNISSALGYIGAPAISPLINALKAAVSNKKWELARYLAEALRITGERAVKPLKKALNEASLNEERALGRILIEVLGNIIVLEVSADKYFNRLFSESIILKAINSSV